MNGFLRELRMAARSLVRSRRFAATVIATLAVAIALQTSVVAVVNAYVVRALPYPGADRLYNVAYAERPQTPPERLASLDWSTMADVVEHQIAWDLDVFYLLGGEYTERAPGAWVTLGFMQGLGIRPELGRAFTSQDFTTGAPQVALISHELWRDRFEGDSSVVGRRFTAYVSDRPEDPETFTIVGVLPASFWHLNLYTQVLTPLRATTYPYMVRLRPDVAKELVERRVERLVEEARLSVPAGWRVELRPTHGEYISAAKPLLFVVGGAATLVFVIACANVALLMVLRGMRRRKEMAVRLALGAGTVRLVRMLLAESLVLGATAACAGVGLAALALRALAPMIETQLGRRVPGGAAAVAIDWTVVSFVGAALLAVALLLSLAPLLGVGPHFSLLRGRDYGGDAGGRRTRSALVAVEVAGSLALLAGSSLMIRSVVRLLDVDLGVRTERVVSAALAVREHSYPDAASRHALYERLLASFRQARGISAVALSTPSPLSFFDPRPIHTSDSESAQGSNASIRAVAGDYFDLLGIRIVHGRGFAETDRRGSEPVAIVSESLARRLWPGENPLGRIVRPVAEQLSSQDTVTLARTVVGVARDVRQSPTDEELADVYVPLSQTASRFTAALVRTSGAVPSWLGVLRGAVRQVDPEIAVGTAEPLDAIVAQQLSRPRFLAWLFAAFGAFSALLGIMGLYAVIAYTVKQREHEIAVRLAVGAQGRQIVGLFLREGSRVVLVGIAMGLVAAVALGRLIQSQLFGVRPADAISLAAVSLLLAATSVAAIWWPSLRASRTAPVTALKVE